jgi:6-phosphogluconolactonase (cycloisomerase 2 family)
VRVTNGLHRLGMTSATLITLGLAWCGISGAPGAGAATLDQQGGQPAAGQQLWTSKLAGGETAGEAVSPNGAAVFVTSYVKSHFETVAYNAATGAQLWARAYQPAGFSIPRAITVSPNGATVYVTGENDGPKAVVTGATVAYNARTGQQLWVSRYTSKGAAALWALAVSPDGTTLYATGYGRASGRQPEFAVLAYAAATGEQRWLRYYTRTKPGRGDSVTVSPDGKTVYATGSGTPSAVTVAYQAAGTLQWADQYKAPYAGSSAGLQVVAGPGGSAVYVVGKAPNQSGNLDIATFAYRAATGKRLWLNRYNARAGGLLPCQLAVTPDGRTVIVTGPRNNGSAGGYAIASYNSTTGATRWTRQAPIAPDTPLASTGLVIDPHGDTAFVTSSLNLVAYSVARGTVLWTSKYAPEEATGTALRGNGTRLFVTGWWPSRGTTTAAYHT